MEIRESENVGNSILERWNQIESSSENILENLRMLEFSRISRFLRISEFLRVIIDKIIKDGIL